MLKYKTQIAESKNAEGIVKIFATIISPQLQLSKRSCEKGLMWA